MLYEESWFLNFSQCDGPRVMLFYSVIQLILSKLFLKMVGAAYFFFKALKHSTNKSINVKYFAGAWAT